MSGPDYVICLECETPCYVFEWKDGALREVICEVCGNDDPDQFATEDEIEELSSGGPSTPSRSGR